MIQNVKYLTSKVGVYYNNYQAFGRGLTSLVHYSPGPPDYKFPRFLSFKVCICTIT